MLRMNYKEAYSINTTEDLFRMKILSQSLVLLSTRRGGSTEDIKHRLGLARNAFVMLNNFWKSNKYTR